MGGPKRSCGLTRRSVETWRIHQPLSQLFQTAASKKLLVIVGNERRDIKPGLIVQQHTRLLRPWFAKSNEFHIRSECLLQHIAVLPYVTGHHFDQTAWSCLAYMFHELSVRQVVWLAFSNRNDAICSSRSRTDPRLAAASVFSSLHSAGSPVWRRAHVRTIQRGDRSAPQQPERALDVGAQDFQSSRHAGLTRNGQPISVCSPA